MALDQSQQQKLIAAGLTLAAGTLLYKYLHGLLTMPAKSTYRIPTKGDPADAIVLIGAHPLNACIRAELLACQNIF
jgi:hypothetical protein